MSLTVELASDGLIWRDSLGCVVASISLVAGTDEVGPVFRGFPPEVWSIEATRHLAAVLSEVARNADLAAQYAVAEAVPLRRALVPDGIEASWGLRLTVSAAGRLPASS